MANDKSVFKYLTCSCGYKKTDPTGKAKALCKNCQTPMSHTENWYARITQNGVTRLKSVSPRKRDAEDYLSVCKVAKRTGDLLPEEAKKKAEREKEPDTTWTKAVENCLQWWKDAVVRKEITQSTADFYKFMMVPLSNYFQGKTLLTIGKGDIIDYQTTRIEEDKLPDTINHEVKALRRVYALHIARTSPENSPRLIARSMDIARVPLLSKSAKKARFLDTAESKLLLKNATTPEVYLAALIGLNTGLRKSNVIDLEWSWVRLSQRVINLPAEQMKSRHPHTIDIPEHLISILKEWRGNKKLTRFLFPATDGKAPINNFRVEWEKTVAACKFTDVSFHTLRHTFASQFLMSGGDLSTLSEILDHSSIQITKDIYGHLSRDHKRKAIDQFATNYLVGVS